MDLRVYYQKIREQAAEIGEPDVVVVSLESSDGGKAGVRMEVPRQIAAKFLVDGRVRLANAEESKEFREEQAEAKRAAVQRAAAERLQITVVATDDLNKLKGMPQE